MRCNTWGPRWLRHWWIHPILKWWSFMSRRGWTGECPTSSGSGRSARCHLGLTWVACHGDCSRQVVTRRTNCKHGLLKVNTLRWLWLASVSGLRRDLAAAGAQTDARRLSRVVGGAPSQPGLARVHRDQARSSAATTVLSFWQKLDLGASACVAKALFHWLRGRFMMLKRMLRIQFSWEAQYTSHRCPTVLQRTARWAQSLTKRETLGLRWSPTGPNRATTNVISVGRFHIMGWSGPVIVTCRILQTRDGGMSSTIETRQGLVMDPIGKLR